MNIFLIGFMGAGKSTFGKKLANALKLDFFDLDLMIEAKAQCSVSDIFKYLGEEAFRKMEQECLLSFIDKKNFVLATGGGAPCYFDNMKFIKENGISVYLEMNAKSIFQRLANAKRSRPTIAGLKNDQLMNFISDTLKKREVVYMKADHKVPGINADVKELISLLR